MVDKHYTIAISIIDNIDTEMLYANGISQNIILLYELFELLGHTVILITETARDNQKLKLNTGKLFTICTLDELKQAKQKIDLFFEAGAIQTDDEKKILRSLGAKIVSIHYGASLIMDMEHILYKNEEGGLQHVVGDIDYLWISPHHAYHQSYLEILYSAPCEIIPFIWNPKFINKKGFGRKDFRSTPNIYVMEPNLSVIKNSLVPLAIIEALYRDDPDAFHHAFIVNGDEIKDKPYFLNNIVTNMPSLNTNVVQDKVFFSDRCRFDGVFVHPDILLSHHWNNGLNYLSLEAIYHTIPLVHNSLYFKEVGYFYPGFDVHKGAAAVKRALSEHKDQFTAHQHKNKVFLQRFSIYNKIVQQTYRERIEKAIHAAKEADPTVTSSPSM